MKKFQTLLHGHGLLLPILFIAVFGFGYQAVPLLSWFFIPTTLLYTRYQSLWRILNLYIVFHLGTFTSYVGSLRVSDHGSRYPNSSHVFYWTGIISITMTIAFLADQFITSNRNCVSTRVLFFSTLWTGLWYLYTCFGGFGDYFSPTVALINWPDFAQIAALGGRHLLEFIVALFGTTLLELPSFPAYATSIILETKSRPLDNSNNNNNNNRKVLLKHPVTRFWIVMLVLLTYGGIRVNIHDQSVFQSSYSEYLPPTVPVGCVVGSHVDEARENQDIWFQKSRLLAEAGAKLILWSEVVVSINDTSDEAQLIERGQDFAKTRQVYLGITYKRSVPTQVNKLVLITKNGEIGIDYNKAHPAPVESQAPGPNVLQYVDTEEFGRIGGGICFDFNFPSFVSQASKHNVDLMLQPSWTWGPIGTHHGQSNMIRAVENGFTLFRCVSQGISGVFEPTLNSLYTQKVATINSSHHLFYLPIQKRVFTLFGFIGNAFTFVCMALSLFIFSFITNTVIKRKRYTPL